MTFNKLTKSLTSGLIMLNYSEKVNVELTLILLKQEYVYSIIIYLTLL